MHFIMPMNILKIQEELREYKKLCKDYNHGPAKKEFDEIVQYILLFSGDGINESFKDITQIDQINSTTMNYLYESFISSITEKGDVESGAKEFDTAVGAAATGAAAVVGGALAAVDNIGSWITYMFKKGKAESSATGEYDAANERLQLYLQIYTLQCKVAELEGKEVPKGDFPSYPA